MKEGEKAFLKKQLLVHTSQKSSIRKQSEVFWEVRRIDEYFIILISFGNPRLMNQMKWPNWTMELDFLIYSKASYCFCSRNKRMLDKLAVLQEGADRREGEEDRKKGRKKQKERK